MFGKLFVVHERLVKIPIDFSGVFTLCKHMYHANLHMRVISRRICPLAHPKLQLKYNY